MTPALLSYIRHLSKQDRKTLSQKALKTSQEVGDLAKVVLAFDNAPGAQGQFVERERILEESIDTVLCALSLAYDLDFTDEEIQETIERKTDKWALLQLKEKDIVYPLPYEVHITVQLPSNTTDDINTFREICQQLECKPIVLDLESMAGEMVMIDVMTSSKHYGTNRTAYVYASNLASALAAHGLEVKRTKIETVPWHPMAPVNDQPMPASCYFEAHIPVHLPANELDRLRQAVKQLDLDTLHASRNTFKRSVDGTIVHMLTLREKTGTFKTFEATLSSITGFLTTSAFNWPWTLGKVHTEFSVYDTKVSHDNAWITAK